MQLRWLVLAACVAACSSGKSASGPLPDAAAELDAASYDGSQACGPPMTTCGTTCTNLASDPLNCGACGHACGCGSTSCTAGVCDSHVLADKQGAPVVLALHGTSLYWGNDRDMNVSTVSVPGGAPSVLFAGRTGVRGFAFSPTNIYFTRNAFNIVEDCLLTGMRVSNLTNMIERNPNAIVADATTAYWTDTSSDLPDKKGVIRSAPLTINGSPPAGSNLATGLSNPDAIAIDNDILYWTTNDPAVAAPQTTTTGMIMKMAKTGGAVTVLADKQDHPHSIAVSGGFVYWSNLGSAPGTGAIRRIAIAGGPITTYADHLPLPVTIAVDAKYVYWTDSTAGAVMRVALTGGAPLVVAAHELAPTGLAVSASCLYFTDLADGMAGTGSVRSHDLN